ncbi:MAG: hypothetical protein HC798_02710 [Polaribacter sp.]|nr:hypothetical protein [Polaribacter sp.]
MPDTTNTTTCDSVKLVTCEVVTTDSTVGSASKATATSVKILLGVFITE